MASLKFCFLQGLKAALRTLFPKLKHRSSVRHLHNNLKIDGHRGKGLKDLLWAVVIATNMANFKKCMDEIKEKNEKAYEWLSEKPAQEWSRSHFSTKPCVIFSSTTCATASTSTYWMQVTSLFSLCVR